MNRKIRKLKKAIERRGGFVHLSGRLPDAIAEKFLEEIMACPECGEQARRNALGERLRFDGMDGEQPLHLEWTATPLPGTPSGRKPGH